MKITESKLKQIIKEETRRVFAEEGGSSDPVVEDIKDAIQMLEYEDDPSGGLFHVINRLQEALEKLESQASGYKENY